jgi:hypothetical protein
MPEPEPSLPHTRAKNATQRPGVEAKKTLQVCRDLAIIQEERNAREKRKEKRERIQWEDATNNEAAAQLIEENRAQQKVTMAQKEALIPCCKSQGM